MHCQGSAFASRGPFAVGVVQTEIISRADPLDPDRRLTIDVWYPARGPSDAAELADHPLGFAHHAYRAIEPERTSSCPLIAFSHGNSGFRRQSTFLTTQLASWGFVVAAPDHSGNTFAELAGVRDPDALRDAHRRIRRQRPHDLAAVVAALADEGVLADSLPALADRIGALGHSFGGWTVLKQPRLEPRVRAVCALAPVSERFVGWHAFAPDELPLATSIDCLVIAGEEDVLVDLERDIRPLVRRLGGNREAGGSTKIRLEVAPSADHFHFCDGIETLHALHESQPRAQQIRPTLEASQLLGEVEMQTWLAERVTRFFHATLGSAQTGPKVAESAE